MQTVRKYETFNLFLCWSPIERFRSKVFIDNSIVLWVTPWFQGNFWSVLMGTQGPTYLYCGISFPLPHQSLLISLIRISFQIILTHYWPRYVIIVITPINSPEKPTWIEFFTLLHTWSNHKISGISGTLASIVI